MVSRDGIYQRRTPLSSNLGEIPRPRLQYWSPKGLSKIGSYVGTPLIADHNSEKKIGLNFARLLVEVDMGATLPGVVFFMNERGTVIEQ